MPPSSRITIRLTQALEALVSDRVRQGSHVSDIVREALAVYLGACLTTRPTPHASVLTSASPVSDSVAALVSDIVSASVSDALSDVSARLSASVSDVSDMRARLGQLAARLEELSASVCQRPTPRLTSQQPAPAAAPEAAAARMPPVPETATTPAAAPPRRRGGRPPSPERQQILALLEAHPEGLSAEELRVYVKPAKPIGDTLQHLRKSGVLRTRQDGKTRRYVLASAPKRA